MLNHAPIHPALHGGTTPPYLPPPAKPQQMHLLHSLGHDRYGRGHNGGPPMYILPWELIIDNFAGGGGASTGIELALGRSPDFAINHDPEALAMHAVNHPRTRHLCEDIWQVKPIKLIEREDGTLQAVALVWLSPDCKHFSKAKGGKPVSKRVRGLAWTALRWAALPPKVRPRVIMLENVEEFVTWGPLLIDAEGNARPDPARRGYTFRSFKHQLERKGYRVEFRERRACDAGAPTIRKRLFLIARCDGVAPQWPQPSHGKPGSDAVRQGKIKAHRTAGECIDWSLPCPSIFLNPEEARRRRVKRPLARPTQARIARGLDRFVLRAARPFIVPLTHQGSDRINSVDEPFRTITAAHRGELALVAPTLTRTAHGDVDKKGKRRGKGEHSIEEPLPSILASGDVALTAATLVQTGYGEREGQAPRSLDIDKPLGTVVAGGTKHALSTAYLVQQNGGPRNEKISGHGADEPLSTITGAASQQNLAAASMVQLRGTNEAGRSLDEPAPTIAAEGNHEGIQLAYLTKYYGEGGQDQGAHEPMHTATAKARMAVTQAQAEREPGMTEEQRYAAWWVARWFEEFIPDAADPAWPAAAGHAAPRRVMLTLQLPASAEREGGTYAIVDIGMRMLVPRELYRAQGFPEGYIIDIKVERLVGKKKLWKSLPIDAQNRMCGNSVSPCEVEDLVHANFAIPPPGWPGAEQRRQQEPRAA